MNLIQTRIPAGAPRQRGRHGPRPHADADAATAAEGLYDLPKPFGNVSFLHMTDCHAQLKPIYFREPSVNLGIGRMKGQLPHLVGEHLLKRPACAPARRRRMR
jgi:sulfur-oxidizing protein SoxB